MALPPSLIKEVLAKIKPSAAEQKKFAAVSKAFLQKLQAKLPEAKAVIGGSGAKGTWLAGSKEVDVFIPFLEVKEVSLSDRLEEVLQKAFPQQKRTRLHGSRDYFQVQFQNFIFEVIPILHIKKAEEAKNITDVSPLHALWLNQQAKKVKDDILLAKQFCKAKGCYGAESHIGGFSGHVLEILIVFYGSFEKFLHAATQWGLQETIDPARHYQGKDIMFALNKSKVRSPLIVIDPVDKNRNAAAALSEEKFYLLKNTARELLKKPSPLFFFPQKRDWVQEAQQKRLNMIHLQVTPLAGKKDVVGVKLKKTFEFLKQNLASFGIKEAHWEWEEMIFLLEKKSLPSLELRQGPPLELVEHVKAFKKMHRETFVKEGKVWANVPLQHSELESFMKALLKEKYVLEKVKKVKKVKVE